MIELSDLSREGIICLSQIESSSRRICLVRKIILNIIVNKETNCWEWQGANSGKGNGAGRGYGRISIDGCTSAVHRVMWACINGYLPARKQVDHKCNNRICCNPNHLEMVTHKQNHRRRVRRAKNEN